MLKSHFTTNSQAGPIVYLQEEAEMADGLNKMINLKAYVEQINARPAFQSVVTVK